jgi:vacuolar-type H+-ATPase subunit E/Vma4
MNDAAQQSDLELRGFIDLIERDRIERSRQIMSEAEARARELVQTARREAARRFRAALADQRERGRRRIDAARAELATSERKRRQELARQLLDRAWNALERELSERWQDPESRARWTAALVERGLSVLPKAGWLIEHPAKLGPERLDPCIAEVSGHAPNLVAHPGIQAGLRITCAGVRLDASLEGLLADRAGVEGRLLVELLRQPAREGGA